MSISTTVLQQQTIVPTASNWSQTVTFAPFDPTLGTLVDVQVGIAAAVIGSVSLENLGVTSGTDTVSLPGLVSVFDPSGTFITSVNTDATGSATLAAFDGTDDYLGTSGTTLAGLSGTQSTLEFYQPGAAELALFSGTTPVPLTVDASVLFNETGLANLQALSQADAGAAITLRYDYIAASPTNPGGGGGDGSGVTDTFYTGSFPIIYGTDSITTTPQTFTISDSTTGWTDDLSVAKFNPTLGTLTAVNISLTGNEDATIGAANLDASSATVDATETATLTLALPGPTATVAAAPSVTDSMSLAAYDGTQDFYGASGRLDQGLTATANGSLELYLSADLAAFTGSGTITLPLSAVGVSNLTGPGNLLTELLDQAGASVSISYTYTPATETTDLTSTTSCFAAGTRIATERGDMTVEALRPGDRIRCVLGETAEAIWIGHRRLDCTRHPKPATVWPVRVCAGAFADGVPKRDLLLSPDHAVFLDDVLIPVKHLINGTTVSQQRCDTVTYYHVELARHDVLLAEGLPTESYLDTGDRANFANAGKVVALHPRLAACVREGLGCAKLCVTGREVTAARAHLAARAKRRGRPQRRHARGVAS
jgi:collagen type I/II/III/V/XI/XXIV/XXVII alpha